MNQYKGNMSKPVDLFSFFRNIGKNLSSKYGQKFFDCKKGKLYSGKTN